MCDDDAKIPIVSDYLPYQYQKLANILLSLNILVFLFVRLCSLAWIGVSPVSIRRTELTLEMFA